MTSAEFQVEVHHSCQSGIWSVDWYQNWWPCARSWIKGQGHV